MQSESRLERKTLQNKDNQVVTDYQNTSDNDIIYNTIGLGLAAITGYGLFKSGAVKPIAKSLLELADNVAQKGGDEAINTLKTIKQWSHLQHLTPEQLSKSRSQTHSPPRRSLFRDRSSTLAYDIYEDFSNLSGDNLTKFRNARNLIDGTVQDLNLLTTMIKENHKNNSKRRNNFNDTELYYQMTDFLNMRTDLINTGDYGDAKIYADKAMEELINEMTLNPKKAEQQLRETGYRNVTLGDLVEIVEVDGSHQLVMKKDAPIDLNEIKNNDGESFLDSIFSFFQENQYGGNKTVLSTNAWKDMFIDPRIKIDKNGKMIDYRMSQENLEWFSHSLASDFHIPLIKINPAKVIGLDKVGRREPLMGIIGPKDFAPDITGIAGQEVTVGDWLGKEFGESYKNKNVVVIKDTAYIVDENRKLKEIANNLRLHDITNADKNFGLKPLHNASRQMSGISTGEPVDLTAEQISKLNSFQRAKYKIGQILDLGRFEVRPNNESDFDGSFDTSVNPDTGVNWIIGKIGDSNLFRVNGFEYKNSREFRDSIPRFNYKTMTGEGLGEYNVDGQKRQPRKHTVTKRGFKVSKAISKFKAGDKSGAKYEFQGFWRQFFAGQRKDGTMSEFFTERTGIPFTIFNQLNEGLASSAKILGLSSRSKRSPWHLAGNLIIKRALPAYLLTKVPEMLNYYSEPFFGEEDELGNRDNITKFLMREVVKPIDIGAHHAMDLVGATKVFKFLGEMVPGSDQINELPGVYQLGLGQSGEERKEYIENGYDPVRKGRYWSSGNTPFTGGKIMYFRPNIYRRVEADVDFSDSKWGSRQEYYNNTWFPNPINPLAPLNHFVFDRHHYDKKHYHDRPYLQTAPAGQNIPIVGPLFSSTIGRVIMPPRKMHLEYWQNGFEINPEDEKPSTLLTEGKSYDNSIMDLNIFKRMQDQATETNTIYQNALYTSAYQAKVLISKNATEKSGITFEQRNFLPLKLFERFEPSTEKESMLPIRTYDRYDTPYEVYSTPSGALSIVDVPDEMNLYNVNQDLKKYSINKVIGTNQQVTLIDDFQGPGIPVGNDSPSVDNAFIYGLGEQFNTLSDIAGLRGFALQAFVTGEANEKARVIEDSGYAYSFNDEFWDANLGGLGGGISEITRRFIPKRNNNVEYVNPIRNTMPSWLPGSDYFTDFKHGDPYSKVDNGEERLPGEGYERLHGIDGLMELGIGSSSIGYEQDYIVMHMLDADRYTSTFEEETLDKGNEIHKEIEHKWLDAGLAIDIEGKIEDKRNNILGYYDAKVHDLSSPTGVAIVDIKSTSAKKLDEIRKDGKPLTHHMRQVNYYLWATGNTKSKGYIYYVDKENPENTYTVGFKFSQKELEKTMENVYKARKTIRHAVKTGELSRGDLYDTVDKFRILADVAPYSQEYRDMAAQLSSESLSAEEKREVKQIRDRVKQQKEPLRVYPYKFKTANLKKETVTVTKILDNNTFITKEYGKEHAIKFAGINVSEDNTGLYKPRKEEYRDKNGRIRTRQVGITKNEAAKKELRKHIRPGAKITIAYDADERNKFSKDSSESIRAVVYSGGTNVNRRLLKKGHATEKENDDSPAGIKARYSSGEVAFGSAMETVTHDVLGNIPFVGSKIMQVRSPYEQYRKREVYGKDFQSWDHPIRDIVVPAIEGNIGNNGMMGITSVITGAFVGRMFGSTPYGKLVGTVIGATAPIVGNIIYAAGSDDERDWRPKRREKQEDLNEYVDTLKYVKNMRLYEQYKMKAKKENNFDVERFIESKEAAGVKNELRQRELTDYKKKVKLDFKHRDRYNFKYGEPKYAEEKMNKEETIRAINKELSELQGERKVTKLPENAMKAIEFRQAAEQTMYGYDPGDSLVDIMSALPKKERQYFKHFMDAPEEEKEKILRIAPRYLRRALQSVWGMPVDAKPTLEEYFTTHGLPDASWVGWDEGANIDDIKVKLVHQNKLDPGEFDIWAADEEQADQVNIPIPKINVKNNPREVQVKLAQLLGRAGYENVQVDFMQSLSDENSTSLNVKQDARDDVSRQIETLEV